MSEDTKELLEILFQFLMCIAMGFILGLEFKQQPEQKPCLVHYYSKSGIELLTLTIHPSQAVNMVGLSSVTLSTNIDGGLQITTHY